MPYSSYSPTPHSYYVEISLVTGELIGFILLLALVVDFFDGSKERYEIRAQPIVILPVAGAAKRSHRPPFIRRRIQFVPLSPLPLLPVSGREGK